MRKEFAFDPKLDFAIERFIDAPVRLVWEALTRPEHIKEWYMPRAWGRVARTELDVRPGGMFSIDIAVGDGQEVPNLGCVLEVVPMERLVWTSMLFPGYRPATFDDVPEKNFGDIFEQKRRADFVRRHAAKKIGELKAQ